MNYQYLIYFKTVAEFEHYTKAADALYITQPALSKAIKNLEMELGVSLFKKAGRNVVLTKDGAMFYEYVKRSVEEIDEGVAAVRHQAMLERNTVCISALFSMYSIYLPEKIMEFRKNNTAAKFSLEYKYTTAVLDDLCRGRCELGICSYFEKTSEELQSLENYVLYREPIGLVVGKNHRFANRKKVSVDELRDERFVVYIRSSRGTNNILHRLCSGRGFEPNIVTEAYNDYGVVGSVASGDGIAILPTSGFLNIDSVVPVELDTDFPMERDINLVWRKDRNLPEMVLKFRDSLIESSKRNN